MKSLLVVLVLLLFVLQYEFWFSNGGVISAWRMRHNIAKVNANNQKLQKRNQVLIADIENLKKGDEAIEERARNEFGMIKKGEVFYQAVKENAGERRQKTKASRQNFEPVQDN